MQEQFVQALSRHDSAHARNFKTSIGPWSDVKRSRNLVAERWSASKDALIRAGLLPATAPGRIQPLAGRSNTAGSPIPAGTAPATDSSKPLRPTLCGP